MTRSMKCVLASLLVMTSASLAGKINFKSILPITASADHIQSALNGDGNLFTGDVKLHFGKRIKISAHKVLIKTDSEHKMTECVIYGDAVLQDGYHYTRFSNGTFDPKTLHLSAQEAKRVR